jgi:hypothetical protein
MGQTTHQIEAHIEDTREDLGSNLHELEQKVKSVTDWKQYFQANSMTMLGAAFGAGIMLATMVGGRQKRGDGFYRSGTGSNTDRGADRQKHKALESWDNIKGALIGVAATRFRDFVDELVPGFREQFQLLEKKVEATHAAGDK